MIDGRVGIENKNETNINDSSVDDKDFKREKLLMIDDKRLEYRLKNLVFSQNLFNTWNRSKREFFEKYIMDIFWSDDSDKDRLFEEKMTFGRDFHTLCQRIFIGIQPFTSEDQSNGLIESSQVENLRKIYRLKKKYENTYGDRVKFFPEYKMTLDNGVFVIYDLLVLIFKDLSSSELERIDIWDWKTEGKEIREMDANSKMQTVVYLYACGEGIGKNVDKANISMHYYQPHLDNNVFVKYSEQRHKEYSEYIEKTIKEIQENRVWE